MYYDDRHWFIDGDTADHVLMSSRATNAHELQGTTHDRPSRQR